MASPIPTPLNQVHQDVLQINQEIEKLKSKMIGLPDGSPSGGSGGGGTMEARIAKLESDVGHIRDDIRDQKGDIKSLRNGIMGAFLIGMGALFTVYTMLSGTIEKTHTGLNGKIDTSNTSINSSLDSLSSKMDTSLDKINDRLFIILDKLPTKQEADDVNNTGR